MAHQVEQLCTWWWSWPCCFISFFLWVICKKEFLSLFSFPCSSQIHHFLILALAHQSTNTCQILSIPLLLKQQQQPSITIACLCFGNQLLHSIKLAYRLIQYVINCCSSIVLVSLGLQWYSYMMNTHHDIYLMNLPATSQLVYLFWYLLHCVSVFLYEWVSHFNQLENKKHGTSQLNLCYHSSVVTPSSVY